VDQRSAGRPGQRRLLAHVSRSFAAVGGNVRMLGLVSLFTDLSSEMIYPLLPVFFTGLVPAGVAAVYVGLMEGISESTASLVKILSGRLSDSLRKRKVLAVAGYSLSTAARPLVAAAAAGWHVIALRFCDRVGKGLRTAPRDALISDSSDPDVRGLAFSFHRAMDHAGAILGSVAAVAILYALLGYGVWHGSADRATPAEMVALRWLFLVALIPGLIAVITLVAGVREIAPTGGGPGTGASGAAETHRGLPRRFRLFVGIVALFALGNSSDLFLLLYGRTKFQYGLLQLMGLWVTLHLSKVVFSLPGGMLSDRWGRRPIIVAGWLVYGLVYLGMAAVSEAWVFWCLIGAYGFYYGMTEGVEKALVSDLVPSSARGRAYGLYHGVTGLAALPASLLFGVFWAVLGPGVAFGIGAGLAGLSVVLLVTFLATSRPNPVHTD
jgi:MFS family permease